MSKKILSIVLALIIAPGIFAAAAPAPAGTTQPPNGESIDSRLAGAWDYSDGKSWSRYFFYEDGTAAFYEDFAGAYHMEGRFTASDGKIFIADFRYVADEEYGAKGEHEDKTVEYAIGSDDKGEYLNIGNIFGAGSYSELRPMKFRR